MDRNQLQTFLSVSSASSAKSQPPPESKRGRLLSLAKQLRQLFPEQREELGRVITRLEKQGAAQGPKSKKVVAGDTDEGNAPGSVNARPISIPAAKRKRARKAGHVRTGSEGTTGGEGFEFDDEFAEAGQVIPEDANRFPDIDEEEEEEIDPRGRPPKRGDVLVHVFIDHSNILIGLLSHLKRNPPYRRNVTNIVRGRPLPTVLAKATTSTTTSDKPDPVSAFAAVKSTTTRPLPIPANGETGTTPKRQNPAPAPKAGSHPIPLPSFATATVSRSLPTGSVLSTYMARRHNKRSSDDTTARRETEANSDGLEYSPMDNEEADTVAPNSLFVGSLKNNREKKAPRHLWHAALTLILERGRPVTRRVVVTSSPLYQPMDSIEHLGYELRVFIRVPDLGMHQLYAPPSFLNHVMTLLR
ncbi:hypothetical protein BDZ97DRAFT_1294389 [Flammula alnicola]|nr:hypothetical protein BDZ97DRAFT_1294389 [Flammula alnicola]